jgi:integrase/recombinase XerD
MSGKKGIGNVAGMRRRRKGGRTEAKPDGFDRSNAQTLASQIDAWFEHLGQRNYSAKTLDMHKWSLRTFLAWSQERDLHYPEEITRPILESYQRYLYRYKKADGKPMAVATQRSRLGALQRFFAWLCRTHQLLANPASDLELPRKQPRGLPKGLSQEHVRAVLNIPDVTDPLGIRDRAILETFYSTGMRRSELTALDLVDLDAGSQTIHIRKGKGGKGRVVPVGAASLRWIETYLEKTRPQLLVDPGEQALFLSGYGERMSSTYVGNWVTKTVKAADIGKRGSCHLFRHSCATHMLENGADIRLIQQLLGHARLDTTQIYTEVAIKALKEVHARTHPSSR